MEKIYCEYRSNNVGLYIEATDDGITGLHFSKQTNLTPGNKHTEKCKRQLDEYFSGKRKIFNLSLITNGSEFQEKAWKSLLKIPFGKTYSYQEQAKSLGNINYTRAVGGANNKNPIPILIPCHRVIGKSGNLTGYAGGINLKKFLLELEQIEVS